MTFSYPERPYQINETHLQPFPSECFPPVLKDVIETLYKETQIPKELIGNVVLAAASLACQSLINVESPYTKLPEQCCLYLMTVAESGEGKTTINKQIMKPFYDFSSEMIKEYEVKRTQYKQEYKIWKVKKQALESNLRKAMRNNYSGEMEEEKIKEINTKEPVCQHHPNFIYEDATLKSLMEGLSEQSEACIISDEAITFFKGQLKNNPSLLNKSWDGESYDLVRAHGERYTVKPCLTISLMSQPGIFADYISNNRSTARESGFLSRFLFSWVNSSVGNRNINSNQDNVKKSLDAFHKRINELLEEVKLHIVNKNTIKKTLRLSDDAISIWNENNRKIQNKITLGNEWEHIKDIGAKSGANILRISAIMQKFYSSDSHSIHDENMEYSCNIMNWYMMQASKIFHPYSERYQFETDVSELYFWLKNRFMQNNFFAIPLNDVAKYGPHRLRRIEKHTPALDQLIARGCICTVKFTQQGKAYISPNIHGFFMGLSGILESEHCYIIKNQGNTRGKYN
ncbi:YfjI family protein [Morganella morganii]|uniref:YfjI family protein n=1 Tax=Morganella morganii TaxID=582 RepID=UPI000F82224B|nr:YfjI family protein [Morganella morganii]RTY19740.1 DUF3987 domain-containing protein [Morganella morganii subsp. morganii]